MKNKSTRHKETNTFKFKPFSERISEIDVNVFHRIGHEYETQADENESHFYQAIQKWNILNLTESYGVFTKEIRPKDCVTLEKLVQNREHVVEVLIKHLEFKNVLCLQPLLEILVGLAQDLRSYFYEYYPRFFYILIELLNTKDTDQLEWTLTCLAYLFKFVWRALIKDIRNVFDMLLPLLSDDKPEYINNFAAESFAFVARKVKDKHAFLLLILKTIKRRQDGVSGCAKLLFEVLKGVDGNFHSCAETIFPIYIEALHDEKISPHLSQVLEQVVLNILADISPDKNALFWNVLLEQLGKLSQAWESNPTKKISDIMDLILRYIGLGIEYKNGKFTSNTKSIISQVLKLTQINLPEEVLLSLSKIVILLLSSKCVKLQQEDASLLTRRITTLSSKKVFLYFVENTFECTSFEALILPTFLQHFSLNYDEDSLKVLTQLLLTKVPLPQSGIDYDNWRKCPIDFKSDDFNAKVEDLLFTNIHKTTVDDIFMNLDVYLSSLVCLPHLRLQNSNKFAETLAENIKMICENVKRGALNNLFVLYSTLECAVHILGEDDLLHLEVFDTLLALCGTACVGSLKILDLYLYVLRNCKGFLSNERLLKIHGVLETNFNSPYHEVRLLTSHIYSLFEQTIDLKPSETTEKWNIFSLCYQIESIQPHVHTYREQLLHLEKLNFDKSSISMSKDTEFKMIPLRYLCGALYMNFKLLWDPLLNVIASHAHGLQLEVFWNVYFRELAVKNVENPYDDVKSEFKFTFLNDSFKKMFQIDDKPDFGNRRLLLWKAMTRFPEICEAKTRDTSELFLSFIEKDYTKINDDSATAWNIKENGEKIAEEDDEDGEVKMQNSDVSKNSKKNNLSILIHHLMVFSKIRSPKSMYREPELQKLYFDLLSHKNSNVQKLALDCIMTYKYKFLTPYRDNLYNLIDDKTFKNELTTFRIDKDSPTVVEEHRENLIPVVMKIVFSKMIAKTGLRTGGKSTGQLRRTLIFRFLGGCRNNEMMSFIRMAFRFFDPYVADNPDAMVRAICDKVDLERFIPPKRLQSGLNLLNVVLEQFGGLMANDSLSFLLRVLLIGGAFLKGAFDRSVDLHSGYSGALRNLRSLSIKTAEKFFGSFDKYPWKVEEINAIFYVFVWPYLDKLNVEGIHSPTALLKLFVLWGSNPRYFPLLVKHKPDDKNQYVLPQVMKLLLNEKTNFSVSNAIMEMLEKLLILQPDEEDLQMEIPIDDKLVVQQDIVDRLSLDEKLNYGSCILLPHAHSILEKIKIKLEIKSKIINQRELFVLSRISELVWESDISDKLLQLLLPVTLKKANADEEIVLKLMTTLKNLFENVEEPTKHLKKISPLFAEVTYASSRKILCEILKSISQKSKNTYSETIEELNAWDSRWVDQPDFQRRCDAFRQIQQMVSERSLDLNLGILIVHNCYHFLKSEKDLSLRENAGHTLKKVCPFLIETYTKLNDRNYVFDTLFNVIRRGMKSKIPDVRNESVSLLGHLARECPNAHVVLRDLNKLTNKTDLEVDFFENLTHLQSHRHARALLRFCSVFKEEISFPNVRTLNQFILPLTSHYLCNDKYVGKNAIVDAAIETMGTTCRLLPWHQYEHLLKFYLSKLRYKTEFQKQLVRLVVAILDSFHFDLSKGGDKSEENDVVSIVNTNKNDEKVANCDTKEVEVEKIANDTSVTKEVLGEFNATNGNDEEIKDTTDNEEVDIDEILENIEEAMEEEESKDVEIKAYHKIAVLCKSAANRVTQTIRSVLLPQLHRVMAEMTQHEASHKVNRRKTAIEREDEDLLRVPISLAVVKLLQKLPKEILEVNLPGVFMKLCTFLKSQLESVRRAARETLQKIMATLGPQYLNLLLDEITPLLSRGFQVHVLVYTIHSVLSCLKETYKPTDIDKVLLAILKLCKLDLFGALADEKDVAKIISKVSEAKSTKSFDTFQILATHITDKCLMDLVLPIKDVLTTSQSYKIVNKAQESLRHIALGLVDNEFISLESLLKFSYGIASESIPDLLAKDKPITTENLDKSKPDCLSFLIPKEPVYRSGYRISNVKSSTKTNANVLTEFGLKICYFLLKRDKITDGDFRPFLDPFICIFKDCLKAKHVKLSTTTLQCLSWILKYDLPSLRNDVKDIAESIFEILHKYGASGLSKGDNFDLVVAAFKTMSVLVRDVKYHTVDAEQLKLLLLYVEQDLHDRDRQASAFSLLKAIISRKLMVAEMHEVMRKVAELSVTSELNHVRLQSRLVFHQFLMDYPLGRKLDKHVSFYVSQLNYELQSGRESSLEMIQTLVQSFPLKVLKDYSGTFLITLGARLVNDEFPEIRKKIAECITAMFTKLPRPDRDPLFDIIVEWLTDKKVNHRRLAAQLCGLLVLVEKSSFITRLPVLTPLILSQFGLNDDDEPGRFVRLKREENTSEEQERTKDHHIFQVLQLLLKISAQCPSFLDQTKDIEMIAACVQSLLEHPHEWVRSAAAQFLGFVLSSLDAELLGNMLAKGDKREGYLYSDPIGGIKSLTLDLCDQLQPGVIKADFAEQVVKNLVFIARVLQQVDDDAEVKINLLWLTKRMRKIVNAEIVEAASSIVLRKEVFKWIAGVSTALQLEKIEPILHHLLAPLVREMITTEESNAPLRQLAKEVATYIKKRIGVDKYTEKLLALQQNLSVKRAERKRARTQLAVTDPEYYAKKKIKHHEKKKEAKKRKIEQMKGTKKKFKRRKVVDLEDNSEII